MHKKIYNHFILIETNIYNLCQYEEGEERKSRGRMEEEGVGGILGSCVLSFLTHSIHSGDKKEKEERVTDGNGEEQ